MLFSFSFPGQVSFLDVILRIQKAVTNTTSVILHGPLPLTPVPAGRVGGKTRSIVKGKSVSNRNKEGCGKRFIQVLAPWSTFPDYLLQH